MNLPHNNQSPHVAPLKTKVLKGLVGIIALLLILTTATIIISATNYFFTGDLGLLEFINDPPIPPDYLGF